MRARSSVSAAATLARIMNSSISRCASSRCGMITRSTVPSGLSRILRSGRSRSSGSRSSRARFTRAIGGIERLEHRFEQRLGDLVGAAVDRGLRLRVVQLARPSASARDGTCASACGRRRRSPCAPRARRDPRSGAASRDRWRCAPAASARRGRGNRPSCRARAPRGRAPSRAARNAPRRRWRRVTM